MKDMVVKESATVALSEQLGLATADVDRLRQEIADVTKQRAAEDPLLLEYNRDLQAEYDNRMAVAEADLVLAEARHGKLLADLQREQEHEKRLEEVALRRRAELRSDISVAVSVVAMIISILVAIFK